MCLGVPGRVVELNGRTATVDVWGVRRETRLGAIDGPVSVGDYVLNYLGVAFRRIPPDEIEKTFAVYKRILKDRLRTASSQIGRTSFATPEQ